MEPWMTTHFPTKCSKHYVSAEKAGNFSSLSTCTLKRLSPLRSPASGETSVVKGHPNKWKQTTCRWGAYTAEKFGFLCFSFLILLNFPYGLPPGSSVTGEWEVPKTCLCFSHGNTHAVAISKQSNSYPYIF